MLIRNNLISGYFQVLDEPSARQSDPSVLELHMRVVSKQAGTSSSKGRRVKKVGGRDTGAMDKWIRDISDLHRSKPAPSVNYKHPMPEVDKIMQVITRTTFPFMRSKFNL